MHRSFFGFHHREQHHAAVVLLGELEGHRRRFHRLAALVDGEQNGLEHHRRHSTLVLAPTDAAARRQGGKNRNRGVAMAGGAGG